MLSVMRPESLQDRTKREWAEATAGETDFGQAGEFPRSPTGRMKEKVQLLWRYLDYPFVRARDSHQAVARAVGERTS